MQKNILVSKIIERLEHVRRELGIKTIYEFAKLIDIPRPNYNNWVNHPQKYKVRKKTLKAICQIIDCDVEWLIDGQGKPPACLRPKNSSIKNPVRIPIIGRVPAGPPDLINETIIGYEYESDPKLKDCFCLKVKGDSMRPTLQPGDTVFFKLGGNIEDGDVIIVNDPFGETMIKRYRVNEKGEELLQSDNPEYAPIKNPGEFLEYRIVGKVVAARRKLNLSMG